MRNGHGTSTIPRAEVAESLRLIGRHPALAVLVTRWLALYGMTREAALQNVAAHPDPVAWCSDLPANVRARIRYENGVDSREWLVCGTGALRHDCYAETLLVVDDDCDNCPGCNAPPSVDCPCDDRRAFDAGVL